MSENAFLTVVVATLNILHAAGLVYVLLDRSRFVILPLINSVVAAAVVLYWLYRLITVGFGTIDSRIAMLNLFEMSLIVLCIASFKTKSVLLTIGSSLGFGIHVVFFAIALLFVLTYKARMM